MSSSAITIPQRIRLIGRGRGRLILIALAALIGLAIAGWAAQRSEVGKSASPADFAAAETTYVGDLAAGAAPEESAGAMEAAATSAASAPAIADSATGFEGDAALAGVPASGISTPAIGQRIAQTAVVGIRVRDAISLQTALDTIGARAAAAGGYTVSLATDKGSKTGPQFATITVRIPVARFSEVLTAVGKTGTELSRSVSSEDLTQDYVDSKSRLRNARALEARLLDLLAKAENVNQALRVQSELGNVQETIEIAKGRLDQIALITTFSTITAELRVPAPPVTKAATVARKSRDLGFVRAVKRGGRAAIGVVNTLATGLITISPFLAIGGVGLVGWRIGRRRLRSQPAATPAE